MPFRTKTLALAVGGIVALGGVTLFIWKRGHAPPPAPIRADTPVTDAAAPIDAGQLDASSDAAKPAAEPEKPLSPECAALQRINAQTIRKFEERKDHCIVTPPDIDCTTMDNGVTWGYRIARIEGEPSKPADPEELSDKKSSCETTSYELELIRRDRKGMKVASSGNEKLFYAYYVKQDGLSLSAVTDYDGDGELEILRAHYTHGREGNYDYKATILTFKNGDVTPYPPAKDLIFGGFEDIDGDGRLDLPTSMPYEGIASSSGHLGDGEPLVSLLFVHHSLPDGTFASGDDAAVAYTRSKCPSPPKSVSLTLEDTTGGSGDVADRLVCARLWGESREKIEGAWNAVCKDFDGGDFALACQEWPLDLAKIAPPFQLR